MTPTWAIAHTLWQGVWLRPHDVTSQVPPVSLEGKGNPPGNTDQVFGLESRGDGQSIHAGQRTMDVLVAPIASSATAARVGVAQIEPDRSGGL